MSEKNHTHNPVHHHHHHHDHSYKDSEGSIKIAFFLNLSFTIIEIIGGLYTNSIAILSDAIHDLGDTVAIGSAWIFEKISYKERDRKFSYGYRRFSPFAALINLVILFAGSIFIISEAIPRLLNPENIDSSGMIIFAILGVVFNGIAVLKLMGNKNSANMRTVMLHLMEDVLGWIAVLIGAIVIHFSGWLILDPILSLGIAAYILINAIKNFKNILPIFLQAVPKDTDQNEIELELKNIEGVKEIHDLHSWSLDGEYNIVTVHLVIPDNISIDEIIRIKDDARKILTKEGQEHYTIEIEFESEICKFIDC
jgi:cobalt-zinc-cadmium efflux system protein